MKIKEPRNQGAWFLYIWSAGFGGIPLAMLVMGTGDGQSVPPFLLLFPLIAGATLVYAVRRGLRVGFHLEPDGIHGAHDAEGDVLPWTEVDRIVWRWSKELTGVTTNGRPAPDGYALHAMLADGRLVRLMQRVAPKYGQQQDLNEQLARARAAGALPVPFDATIPTHDQGEWSGTPPSRNHTTWDGGDLPQAGGSPLEEDADGDIVWPTG